MHTPEGAWYHVYGYHGYYGWTFGKYLQRTGPANATAAPNHAEGNG